MSIQMVENVIKNNVLAGEKFITKFVDIGQGSGKLNKGVLQAEKSDKFIQALTSKTVFLDKTKLIVSKNHRRELDTMSFDIELQAGRMSGTPKVLKDEDYQVPTYGNRVFRAEELRALTGIHRTAMKENIEGPGFMNTLTNRFGEANGRALENVLIYGNTASSADVGKATGYKVVDGILKKLTDDAVINNETIDLTAADSNPINEIRHLLDSFPDVYKDDGGLALFCPSSLKRAVRRYVADNHQSYDVSEVVITRDGDITVEDVPLIAVPSFSVPKNGYNKKPAILTHKENIQWLADPENIIVESDFNLRANVWDIASTMYADINFAFPDASALAWLKEA